MSFNFKELERKYTSDAPFNKVVNLHRDLLERYGFMPSEIREAFFYAQYIYEMNRATEVIRTQDEWRKSEEARKILQHAVLSIRALTEPQPLEQEED